MATKKCLRSGQCCSGHFALIPKNEDSNLNPQFLDSLPEEGQQSYIENNSEMMGKPCKWLILDEVTTEATCTVHERKSSNCLEYPEHIVGSEWCPVGVGYWRGRDKEGLPIPEWVKGVLSSLNR